ncbi:MAG TPA: fibro-slime domain-containing protein, partial [Polyangiaceae bacterium]
VEPGWECPVPGRSCTPVCGDEELIGSEQCDDGNRADGDGCSSRCAVEPGSMCTLPMPGAPSVCTQSACGNGTREAGESCDLGILNGIFNGDGTGCSRTCSQEPECRPSGTTQACAAVCGDANVDAGEQCDDGNGSSGDGCSATCTIEMGFVCTETPAFETQPCSTGAGQCLVLPITYRDFDGQNQAQGHPDFYFLGGSRVCVPNASGRPPEMNEGCWASDSTPLCKGIAAATLGPDGKPALGAITSCACRFTDWDNTGILQGASGVTTCAAGAANPQRIELSQPVVASADSFREWYADSAKSQRVVSSIELAQTGTEYRFSSSDGRTVYEDLHDIFMGVTIPAINGAAANTLSSGFFPLEALTGIGAAKTCNLSPYWTVGSGPCVAGDGYNVPQQWDPKGSYTAMMAGTGGPVKPVTGVARNFYFTSEVRYLFRYGGSGSISFRGDDDTWIYVNGRLALDLGAPHERLQGSIALNGSTGTWTILTTDTTGAAVPPASGGTGTVELGLEIGKTYELAVFHADRHPRESNYELTLSAFPTVKTACVPD